MSDVVHAPVIIIGSGPAGLTCAGDLAKMGYDKVYEAGCLITGGHSIFDDEPKYGLSVTGFVHPDKVLTNSGAKPGDVLVLTKQIGSGVINTAVKAQMASDSAAAEAAQVMSALNQKAKRAAEGHTVVAPWSRG